MKNEKFNTFSTMLGHKTPEAQSRPIVAVIDDNPKILESLEFNLSRRGYSVKTFDKGTSGVLGIDKSIAVVILDIKMPDKDGLQVYKEIKAKFPDLPIIFYSAYQNVLEGAKISLKYAPFNYVDKSEDIIILMTSIERAVKLSARLSNLHSIQKKVTGWRPKTSKFILPSSQKKETVPQPTSSESPSQSSSES